VYENFKPALFRSFSVVFNISGEAVSFFGISIDCRGMIFFVSGICPLVFIIFAAFSLFQSVEQAERRNVEMRRIHIIFFIFWDIRI
jgi:hypothetical protein